MHTHAHTFAASRKQPSTSFRFSWGSIACWNFKVYVTHVHQALAWKIAIEPWAGNIFEHNLSWHLGSPIIPMRCGSGAQKVWELINTPPKTSSSYIICIYRQDAAALAHVILNAEPGGSRFGFWRAVRHQNWVNSLRLPNHWRIALEETRGERTECRGGDYLRLCLRGLQNTMQWLLCICQWTY